MIPENIVLFLFVFIENTHLQHFVNPTLLPNPSSNTHTSCLNPLSFPLDVQVFGAFVRSPLPTSFTLPWTFHPVGLSQPAAGQLWTHVPNTGAPSPRLLLQHLPSLGFPGSWSMPLPALLPAAHCRGGKRTNSYGPRQCFGCCARYFADGV